MKTRKVAISTMVVVAMLSGAVNAATGERQNQQVQLEEIEKYISQRRQKIKNYFLITSTELKLRGEAKIRLLEVADIKPVFAGFAGWAAVTEAVLEINGLEPKQPGYFEPTAERPPKRLAMAQSQIAKAKNDILRLYGFAEVSLERQKRYALSVELVELEKRLKENVLTAKPKTTHGVVSGLIYDEENPCATVDGKIVREGDIIHGVKVVKIQRDGIEFERNGNKWVQKVQETREAFWQ